MGTKVKFLKNVRLRTKAVGLEGAKVLAWVEGQEDEVDEKALKYIDENSGDAMYEKAAGKASAPKAKSKGGK